MADQKLENLLNISLQATKEEREKSEELGIGYDPEQNTWELIVLYGQLRRAENTLSADSDTGTVKPICSAYCAGNAGRCGFAGNGHRVCRKTQTAVF